MNDTDRIPIDVAKAVEAGYWFGMIDAIRDVYRMTFKDVKPDKTINEPLSIAVDSTLQMANIDHKHMLFAMDTLENDIHSLKQNLWSHVFMGLPKLKEEIVDRHMTEEFEGVMQKRYAEFKKRKTVPMSEEEAKRTGQ